MAKCKTAFTRSRVVLVVVPVVPLARLCSMRAEKLEKLGSEMGHIELLKELKTRRNGRSI